MNLGELVKALERAPHKNRTVRWGFGMPHSSRGDYSELAFDPVEHATVESMLSHAKSALGETFEGWKGGEYKMSEYTPCWIEVDGNWDRNGISAQLVNYWLMEAGASESDLVPIRYTYP